MQKKINIKDVDKRQVFKVPDTYFENLPPLIRRRINSQSPQTVFAWPWVRYTVALGSVCLIILVMYGLFVRPQSGNHEQIIAEIAGAEIIEYLQYAELSPYDVMEAASKMEVSIDDSLQQAEINTELLLDEADMETLHELI